MDGWWKPKRVNCWPLYVRLGDTLGSAWPRKSMHPFVLSRYQPSLLRQPPPLTPPLSLSLSFSLSLFLSVSSHGPLLGS